jgi:hypothetical protein
MENIQNQELKYFETYQIKNSDLEEISRGIENIAESNLFEDGILDEIRFVTYDSKKLYVFTRGHHATNENFSVEEITSSMKNGFRIFAIHHSGFIGKKQSDYRGAKAWLLCDEIETTAVYAKKFPNENILYEPDMPQPKEILDVVSMAPKDPYEKIQKGKFNYLTDVMFHEVAHIEHRRLENWQEGEEKTEVFPSGQQKESFLSAIRKTKIFPQEIISLIIENIDKRTIEEMYAMLVDREAAKRYDVQKFEDENAHFQKMITDLQNKNSNQEVFTQFQERLQFPHVTGRLLVRILEDQFSDFHDRKKNIRSILEKVSK